MALKLSTNFAQTIIKQGAQVALGTPAGQQTAAQSVRGQLGRFFQSSITGRHKDTTTVYPTSSPREEKRAEQPAENATVTSKTNQPKSARITPEQYAQVLDNPFFIKDESGKPTGEWHP